jgi:hypothetical protein
VPHAEAVYVDGNQAFLLRAAPDSNEKWLQINGSASHMVIHRIAARPATCDQPTPNRRDLDDGTGRHVRFSIITG